MNRKQLITLIVLVAVIGGAGLVLFNKKESSFSTGGQKLGEKLFPKLSVNDVAQIQIKQSDGEVNLVKQDDLWRVKERNNYPANFSQIGDFLVKASNLKIGQTEEVGPSQHAKLELLEPSKGKDSGTVVEFKDASGKALQTAILGKKQMRKSDRPSPYGGDEGYPIGRYVLLQNDSQHVFLVSDALSEVEPKPENWLNKDFFKIEKVRSISLTSTNATNSWELTRESESAPWTLVSPKEGEQLDTNKVSGIASSLSYPSFIDVATEAKLDSEKTTSITLETFDDLVYTLKIGNAADEDNYLLSMSLDGKLPKERVAGKDEKPEDKEKLDKEFAEKKKQLEEKLKKEKQFENWTYVVAKWTVDPLLRDRAHLMVEKKDEPKNEENEPPSPDLESLLDPTVPRRNF